MNDTDAIVVPGRNGTDLNRESVDKEYAIWLDDLMERDTKLRRIQLERTRRIINGKVYGMECQTEDCGHLAERETLFIQQLRSQLASVDQEIAAMNDRHTFLKSPRVAAWQVVLEISEVMK